MNANVRSKVRILSTAGLLLAAGCAVAQPQGGPGMQAPGMQGRQDMPMHGGGPMMGGSADDHGHMHAGRMGRMHGRGMMAHPGGMMGGHHLPQLPPGNEKLELQMHAEMMQRMGEILAKYAARIKE